MCLGTSLGLVPALVFVIPQLPASLRSQQGLDPLEESEIALIAEFFHTPANSMQAKRWGRSDQVVVFIKNSASGPAQLVLLEWIDGQWKKKASAEPEELDGGLHELDLAPYRLNESEGLIGLRCQMTATKVDNQYLRLFRVVGDKLICVLLADMSGSDYKYSWKEGITDQFDWYERTISVGLKKTNGFFDLISKVRFKDTGLFVRSVIRWEGSQYQEVPPALETTRRNRRKHR